MKTQYVFQCRACTNLLTKWGSGQERESLDEIAKQLFAVHVPNCPNAVLRFQTMFIEKDNG